MGNGMELKHDITMPMHQVNDKPIMTTFHEQQVPLEVIPRLNKCRPYKKQYFLSDCFTAEGIKIKTHVLQGIVGLMANGYKWPRQGGGLTADDWAAWRHYMLDISHHMMASRARLGEWTGTNNNPWFISPDESNLYQQTGWLSYKKRSNTRRGYHELRGTTAPAMRVHQAVVWKFQHAWACLGTYKKRTDEAHTSFVEHIAALEDVF